ncbi:MAG TPA: glycosyltransferase, partial [Anaerolineae bacterium]|nr:glycosyltransferase [Anaerolineae bacterium]
MTSVVIVNWNGKHYLPSCLMSLRKQVYQDLEIILVDNGSSDGSVDFVRENFPEVEVIESSVNLGFAAGNNLGF